MRSSGMHYFPLTAPFLIILAILLILVVALIELRILSYAYEKIGIDRRHVFGLLLLSLLGSYVNIPVAELPPAEVRSDGIVSYYGVQHVIPHAQEWPRTIIAVNLGGAVIPTFLTLYLMIKNGLFLRGLIGVAIVTAIVHWLAQPVKGLGITVPIFIPPLAAAGVALLLDRRYAAPLAYISGTLGSLIGADILNLNRIEGLQAPVASIGGAGTFDGVFLTGIIAVLLVPTSNQFQPRPEFRMQHPVRADGF
jgi:uncharacterized membrane protein